MGLNQAQWNAKIKKFVPSWRFGQGTAEIAFFQAIAALFAAYDADADSHFNSTFLTRATTPVLDTEGDERSVARGAGEADASYAGRIQVIANSNNLPSLQAAVNACLNNGTALIFENSQVLFADSDAYCDDPISILPDGTKDMNFFSVIIPAQTAGDFSVILASIISALETDKAFGVSYDVLCQGGPMGLLSVVTKTTTYAMTTADDVVLANANGGSFSVTLPNPVTTKFYCVKKINPGNRGEVNQVTVLPHASETVAGGSSYVLTAVNHSVIFVSDGTNWHREAESFDTAPLAFSMVIGGSVSNPTKGAATYDIASYSVDGKRMRVWYSGSFAAGSAGSGFYTFALPSGYTADTSKMGGLGNQNQSAVGSGSCGNIGNNYPGVSVALWDSTHLFLVAPAPGGGTDAIVGSTFCPLSDTNPQFSFEAEFAIL